MVEVEESKIVLDKPDKFDVSNAKSLVVGIPAYNEEKTIAHVIQTAQKYADIVIVCDDGSCDLTADISEHLGAVVVKHEKNLGKGRALKSIFEAASKFSPQIVVTIDADGQHNPEEIPQVIQPIISGQTDMVIGSRYASSNGFKIPRYRQIGLRILNWLNKKANKTNFNDSQNGFRAYNSKALKVMSSCESNGFSVESEQIILGNQAGLKMNEVSISTQYEGLNKTSTKSPITHGLGLISYILKVIVEDRPLTFLGIPGLLSLVIGVSFGVWMLQIYSLEHMIETNVALASVAFVLIGLFCCFASINLYSISRLSQKLNHKAAKD